MKKKQVIIIAAALAVVLLTSTAVYAIGSLSPEDNQVNKPVEQPSLSTAAVEAEELQAPLTAEQVDISAYSVPLGTKAEQILRNTLTKKQMTEQEMQYYNSMPDEIKMLTRAEAVERLEELTQYSKDGSSYHLACYDPETGNFIKGETSQGYSNESTWSRGQGWGIYGFTLCYRETKDPRFLKTAQRMADYYINNPNLPSDKIPWWDFDTHRPGFIPGKFSKTNKYIQNYRDASAASVTASALLELSSYVKDDKKKIYTETALQILTSLSSPEYRAEEGKNGNFILKHSTGAIPHGSEVDVPLIYADYYFLESLLRYNRMINNKPIL